MARGATSRNNRRMRRKAAGISKTELAKAAGVVTAGATGSTSLPLSDRDAAWDAAAASKSLDPGQFDKAFFWHDDSKPEDQITSYKLGFATADGGSLTAVWRGVTAVAGALSGARGGVKIPDDDVAAVKKKVEAYYAKAREKYGDDSIQVPWADGSAAVETGDEESLAMIDPAAFADMGSCECGHSFADHLGEDGPCTYSDDNGDCSCAAYEEAEAETAAAALAIITAAGVPDVSTAPVETIYDMSRGSIVERRFYAEALIQGYSEVRAASWPFEGDLGDHGDVLAAGDGEAVFRLDDGTIVYAESRWGWFRIATAAATRSAGADAVSAFAAEYPALYRDGADDGTVPITFWTLGRNGPVSRMRMIDSASWADIGTNYPVATREALGALMNPEFELGKDGQLVLWQGPPGTGKTWGLRALASEWRDRAEFHYITDPDAFFVREPAYMIDVLLADTYDEYVVTPEGDPEVTVAEAKDGKWRVLILEDTGELLSATAKEDHGQGLSRLLNVVDGMVGQGLRVLTIITTNDELGDLHPAAIRPGRCAAQIEFGAFSIEEANTWLGAADSDVSAPMTLAELYARRGDDAEAFAEEQSVTADAAISAPDAVDQRPEANPSPSVPVPPIATGEKRWRAVLVPEGTATDDGRMFAEGAVSWRDLPLSLGAMLDTPHADVVTESKVCGRIDSIRREGNLVVAEGVFDSSEFGQEIARMVGEGMLRGISVDVAPREYEVHIVNEDGEHEVADPLDLLVNDGQALLVITDGVIGAVTVCPFPAFAEANISLLAAGSIFRFTSQAGIVVTACACDEADEVEDEAETLTAAAAGLAPLEPPAAWFADPELSELTPLTITDDGRVYGHLAPWGTCHIGIPGVCVTAPNSEIGYSMFHLGEVVCSGGERVAAGKITLGAGHADQKLGFRGAIEHYDNTGNAAADVRAGEDDHGVWLAGAIRPDITAEALRTLRAAPLSGDWRSINGNLELVAALAVNVPGFPVPRTTAQVVVADGRAEVVALVSSAFRPSVVDDATREKIAALAASVDLDDE